MNLRILDRIFGPWCHTPEVVSHTSQYIRSYDHKCAVIMQLRHIEHAHRKSRCTDRAGAVVCYLIIE